MKTFTHVPITFDSLDQINGPSGRRYALPDGTMYPSVTTVLSAHSKEGIDAWVDKIGEKEAHKIKTQAGNRGTAFHELAEAFLSNKTPTISHNLLVTEMFTNARPALLKIDNIRALETRLYSTHLRMAGTVDCVGDYDRRLSVIDFKTSIRPKPLEYLEGYFMQATAYSIMFEELTGQPISNLVLIIAVEDGTTQVMKGKRDNYVERLIHYRDLYEASQ